jgi:hypothetical protein
MIKMHKATKYYFITPHSNLKIKPKVKKTGTTRYAPVPLRV